VQPGTPGLARVVEEFGPEVLAADGSLDRQRLATFVFGHPERLAALNAIVHPYVRQRSEELTTAAPDDAVVVQVIPLLVENTAGGEHAMARRDDRHRIGVDFACTRLEAAREQIAERCIRAKIELRLVEVCTDGSRKRPVCSISQRHRHPSPRGQSDQRRVDGSWLPEFHAINSASPPG
jgi:hypothetical protein